MEDNGALAAMVEFQPSTGVCLNCLGAYGNLQMESWPSLWSSDPARQSACTGWEPMETYIWSPGQHCGILTQHGGLLELAGSLWKLTNGVLAAMLEF